MVSKPAIITTRKVLPFDALEPLEFERLSLWLVEREGYLRPQHLGDAGSEQGRDVVAYKKAKDGEELWYFQCKRYQALSGKTLIDEVDKYNALARSDPAKKCTGIVFITSAKLTARTREIVVDYCQQHGYQCDFWARTELDMRVKKYREIVEEFFAAGESLTEDLNAHKLEVTSVHSCSHLIKEYCDNLQTKVNKVTILGATTKYELADVFIKLNVVKNREKPSTKAQALYWSLMDADLRKRRNNFAQNEDDKNESLDQEESKQEQEKSHQMVTPGELLHENTCAIIVGAPGSGKTTLLRYLTFKTLKRNKNLPIFLELKTVTSDDFKNARGNLETLLFEKAVAAPLRLNDADSSAMKQVFNSELREANISIFLDGLDEVSGTEFFDDLQHSIKEFLDSSYGRNNLIITTRPYASRLRFKDDHGLELEIAPLDLSQIKQFISKYFGDNAQTRNFFHALRNRSEIRELARVPALLGFLANIEREPNDTVQSRLELYRLLIHQLVNEWDEEKGAKRGFLIQNKDRRLDFLRHLAFNGLFGGDGNETVGRLIFTSEGILLESERYCRLKQLKIDPDNLASDVLATPLLREVRVQAYAFTHLIIQEYLAAEALVKNANCENLICQNYFDQAVCEMEVLPMAMGLLHNASAVYRKLAHLPDSLSFTNFRLQLRGLSYGARIDSQHLESTIARVIGFVTATEADITPYIKTVLESLSREHPAAVSRIVDAITAQLEEDDCAKWDMAALALGWIGAAQAVSPLLRVLHEKDHLHARKMAAVALGLIKSEKAVEGLIVTLDEEDSKLRGFSIQALGRIGADAAVGALIRMLGDSDETIKTSASEALEEIGSDYVVSSLSSAFNNSDNSDRQGKIIDILRNIGTETAVDVLLLVLRNSNEEARRKARWALREIDSESAEEALISFLQSTNDEHRKDAISGLRFNKSEAAIAAASAALLNDTSEEVRAEAAEVLGESGSQNAVGVLINSFVNDDSERVRNRAAHSLGSLGSDRSLETLIEIMLHHPRVGPRGYAANAIAGVKSDRAIPALSEALIRGESYDQHCAASALAEIGSHASISALRDALADPRFLVREAAAIALMDIGLKDGLDILYGILYSNRDYNCGDAAKALGKWKIVGAVDGLREVVSRNLKDQSSWIWSRTDVITALCRIGDEQAIQTLMTILQYGKSEWCLDVLKKINEVKSEGKTGLLLKALLHEDVEVRRAAAFHLNGIDSEAVVLPQLSALRDDDYWVGVNAARSLEACGISTLERALCAALSNENDFIRGKVASVVAYYSDDEKTLEALRIVSERDANKDVRSIAANSKDELKEKLKLLSISLRPS